MVWYCKMFWWLAGLTLIHSSQSLSWKEEGKKSVWKGRKKTCLGCVPTFEKTECVRNTDFVRVCCSEIVLALPIVIHRDCSSKIVYIFYHIKSTTLIVIFVNVAIIIIRSSSSTKWNWPISSHSPLRIKLLMSPPLGSSSVRLRNWPSCDHDPNLRLHFWSSKGNHVMSMAHVLLNMPGGTHRQLPSLDTTTLVGKVASKLSLALKFHDKSWHDSRVSYCHKNAS